MGVFEGGHLWVRRKEKACGFSDGAWGFFNNWIGMGDRYEEISTS